MTKFSARKVEKAAPYRQRPADGPIADLHPNDPDNARDQPPSHGGATARNIKALPFIKFDDMAAFTAKRWIMKGLIARGETSSWIGPPGSGKSSLIDDVLAACAQAVDWHGHRAKEVCGGLIFALERGDLHKRRFVVYRQRDGLKGLPIAVANSMIDLMRPDCVEIIVATVRAVESDFGHPIGMIVIDTFNKGIAVGGGDEDKAKDQNRAAAHLRMIHERLDVHIALVGHTGKNEDRGPRGSNAHLGDVDVMVQISGDGPVKVAKITKANDQPERTIATFRLKTFEFDKDEDGDPIDVAVVEAVADEADVKKQVKLSKLEQAALHELSECVADHAEPPPTDPHCPQGSKGVSLDTWRERLRRRSITGQKGDNGERLKFMRIKDGLHNKGRIGIWDDFVWPVPSVSPFQTVSNVTL